MDRASTDISNLKGQAFVEALAEQTWHQVAINHEEGLPFIDVDLKNQANAEASSTRDYFGRYLFELLQNANDAILAVSDNPEWIRSEGYRIRIELTSSALIVANDGVPFLEKDVDSIYRWGESSKDPNKSIGHKGIGFKSVLEISYSPEILSQVVQFRFDRDTCYDRVREITGNGADLKLPITRFVLPHKIENIKAPDKALVQELLHRHGFATVIRLPLRVEQDQVIERISEDVKSHLLLFLNGIDRIEVWQEGKLIRNIYREIAQPDDLLSGQEIMLFEDSKPLSRWLLFSAPKSEIKDNSLISDLEDQAWDRVTKAGFAIAFPLDTAGALRVEVDNSSKLFVYFPTGLDTGLRFRIHGDFYIDAARRQVRPKRYNLWLAKEIANYLADTVMPELARRFPQDVSVVEVLAPRSSPSDFAGDLYEALCGRLTQCAFVPTSGAGPQPPTSTMLMPEGASVDVDRVRTVNVTFRYQTSNDHG
jgi:hypothetical protein